MSAAVIIIRQKRIVRRFQELGAVDAEHAIDLDRVDRARTWIFRRMLRRAVFLATDDGRYYLDTGAAIEFFRFQRRRALVLSAVVLVVFFVGWGVAALIRGR